MPEGAAETDRFRRDFSGLNGVAFCKSPVDAKWDEEFNGGVDSGPDCEIIQLSRLDSEPIVLKQVAQIASRTIGPQLQESPLLYPLYKAVFSVGKFLSGIPMVRAKANRFMSLSCEYNAPKSRGELMLSSADPREHPIIDCAWLRDPRDLEATVWALKKMRRLLLTQDMAPYFDSMEFMPGIGQGKEAFLNATDEQLKEYILSTVQTTWHYSCTVRMGPTAAPVTECALDPELRVRGVEGLRVADCSAHPLVVSANTNAAAMMTGDWCGEQLVQEYG